jgi:hypothetical protein
MQLLFATVLLVLLSAIVGFIPAFRAERYGVNLYRFTAISAGIIILGGFGSMALQEMLLPGGWFAVAAAAVGATVMAAAVCLTARFSLAGVRSMWGFPALLAIGAFAAALTVVVKVIFAGWFILFEAPIGLFFGTAILHVSLRACVISIMTLRPPVSFLLLLMLSDALLFATALFRWDIGDGPDWLTLTAMLGEGPGHASSSPPAWLRLREGGGLLYNFVLYVPVALCWIATMSLLGGQAERRQ